MKILLLYILFVASSLVQAQTRIPYGDLTFGDSVEFVKVGVSVSKEDLKKVQPGIVGKMKALFATNIHPFAWPNSTKVEFLWIVDGSAEAIQTAIKEKAPAGTTPAWMHWKVANNQTQITSANAAFKADGNGTMKFYSGSELVGQCSCQSGIRTEKETLQPDKGTWSLRKCSQAGTGENVGEKGYQSIKHDAWMAWAYEIQCPVNQGCFWHSGPLDSASHSCVRLSDAVAKLIYSRVKSGAKIEVVYE